MSEAISNGLLEEFGRITRASHIRPFLYAPVLDAMPFPVRVADADTNWIYVNTAAEKLIGVKREDMIGKPCDHNKFCICGTDNCSLSRARRGVLETQFKHDDSSYKVEVAVLRDSQGDISGFVEMIHDITESANNKESLKNMMGEVNRKNQLLQAINHMSSTMLSSTKDTFDKALLHSMEIMAKAVKADRAYLWKNFTKDGRLCCRQLYEWSEGAEAQQGQDFTIETVYSDTVPEWVEAFSNGECVNGIVRGLSANEQAILVPQSVLSVLALPIFIKEEFWGFIGFDDCHRERRFSRSEEAILRSASVLIAEALIRHDMEESLYLSGVELQRALNEAQTANHAKSEFLSSMSHEMRTPLNAVIGMTAIGLRSPEAERKNYALDKIEEASTHLLGVINDILDMSKIEAGKMDLSAVEFNFEKMLQKVITVISYRVNEKRQQFTVSVAGDVPRFVVGDDQRLAQIITNLLANAAKFTPEKGAIHLGVSLIGEENGLNELRVEVTDTGIGISSEQLSKLFRSFGQAESGISREYGGTGLGLSISKRLVELMGGRIWVESELGKGSRFIFTVKIPSGAKSPRSLLSPGVAWETVRVMAIEDSESGRKHYEETFERLGVQCVTVADGISAYSMIETHGMFDIYFISINSSGIKRSDFARLLKVRDENCKVVLISSGDWESLQEAVRDSGADKGLIMPILSSALVDCMNECLGNPHKNHISDNTGEFAGKTILLAEDIEINREIVISLLENTGIAIDCAENGKDALYAMNTDAGKYDVVLMDMQMPYIDGLEATRRIRALPDPWCKMIPIIAMTANVFKDDIESCISAGMSDHIGKPVDIDDMMIKLRRYLFEADYAKQRLFPGNRSAFALLRGNGEHIARLTEGTKVSVDIRILDGDGKRGTLSLPSVVEEIHSDGFFLIRPPLYKGEYYPLPKDEMFLIYFAAETEKGATPDMYVIPARFVERVELASSVYAKLEPLGKIERSQRRDCSRIQLSLPVLLKRKSGGNISAMVLNISSGGVLVATDTELNINESITMGFFIGEREVVEGVVLRSDKLDNETHKYSAAIEFRYADEAQKERFSQFFIEKENEKIVTA